eukprot:scaffold2077_cov85-Skeletonema_dohrnii-CCMP3373.AAC.1
MKVQLFASTALMLLSAIPGALSAEHLHPKEAVAATAADFEDDFEEKSPSAKSFSLRGAVAAAAASAEDSAADEDEELIQWKKWGQEWKKHADCDWEKDYLKCARKYHHHGTGYGQNGEHCYKIHVSGCPTKDYQGWKAQCKVRNNKCVPKNFEDEEFDSQDLEMFDAPEDAVDEDEELIQWQDYGKNWRNKNWDDEWKNHAKNWQTKNWGQEWKNHAKNWQTKNWGQEWKNHANCDWKNDWQKCARKYDGTGHGHNGWGNNPFTGQPYGAVANDWCYGLNEDACPTNFRGSRAPCEWRNNECVPRN